MHIVTSDIPMPDSFPPTNSQKQPILLDISSGGYFCISKDPTSITYLLIIDIFHWLSVGIVEGLHFIPHLEYLYRFFPLVSLSIT